MKPELRAGSLGLRARGGERWALACHGGRVKAKLRVGSLALRALAVAIDGRPRDTEAA